MPKELNKEIKGNQTYPGFRISGYQNPFHDDIIKISNDEVGFMIFNKEQALTLAETINEHYSEKPNGKKTKHWKKSSELLFKFIESCRGRKGKTGGSPKIS